MSLLSNCRYLQFSWRYLQIHSIWRYLQLICRYLQQRHAIILCDPMYNGLNEFNKLMAIFSARITVNCTLTQTFVISTFTKKHVVDFCIDLYDRSYIFYRNCSMCKTKNLNCTYTQLLHTIISVKCSYIWEHRFLFHYVRSMDNHKA